ncbi:FAD-dependent monooxygenase [Microvirga sp. BT689]|uniref:FAD-dependent oxidoreductase n=1 Tax=Microvirga arvi TaxID=2778731 RepID=UPI0019525B10|nr:NAD(P)/FAD-dependent oxidoreductase [Microvirga arvi]MBM6584253.1 FAD-dependent monooxygenase [Microvirga arvi]
MKHRSASFDVVIIGAGLAGTTLAGGLARSGKSVALIDIHSVHPREFRGEKFGPEVMTAFEELGWGSTVRDCVSVFDAVRVVHFGRLVETKHERAYSAYYSDLVNGLRSGLPNTIELTIGRVIGIELSSEIQTVRLKDEQEFKSRLVVLATGLGEALLREAGVLRQVVNPRHSLVIGFDMAAHRECFPFVGLTYNPESYKHRTAYLTMFPVGDRMRANLFSYREPNEPWTKAFRANPERELALLMPRLRGHCPNLSVTGPVEIRSMDLVCTTGYDRDGIVLVGDAFQTACPASGTGMFKVATDVKRLASIHIPNWLATPGMSWSKIKAFYSDPVKRECDNASMRSSLRERAINTDSSIVWSLLRSRRYFGRHAYYAQQRTVMALIKLLGASSASKWISSSPPDFPV